MLKLAVTCDEAAEVYCTDTLEVPLYELIGIWHCSRGELDNGRELLISSVELTDKNTLIIKTKEKYG